MDRIKCTACKRMKMKEDYLKNGKTLKTCIACREKKKEYLAIEGPEPVQKLIPKPTVVPTVVPVVVPVVVEPVKVTKTPTESKPGPIVEPIVKPIDVHLPIVEHVLEPVKPQNKPWVHLSGKWIKLGDEEKLHKTLTEKMNREFKKKAAFAVHKYLTKWIMIDIRDR